MSREKNKDLIILIPIGIIASITIWIFLWCETDKLIQSQLIIILIVTTIYYAIQTYRLVEEGKKKRSADFYQQRLTEFFLPLKNNLLKLLVAIKSKPFSIEMYGDAISEFATLMNKGYMLSLEFEDSLYSFVRTFPPIKKSVRLEETKIDEIFEKSEELVRIIKTEIFIFECLIKEVYGFDIDKELHNFVEELKVKFNLNLR